MTQPISPPLYLEDISPGDRWVTESVEITASDIIGFARQYDPQPFHTDEVAAKTSFFGGLAASGWHTAAVTMRLMVTSGLRARSTLTEPGYGVERALSLV